MLNLYIILLFNKFYHNYLHIYIRFPNMIFILNLFKQSYKVLFYYGNIIKLNKGVLYNNLYF